MPLGNMRTLNDWDLLDMAEGLQQPTTIEWEMTKRFRQRLEKERAARFDAPFCNTLPPALDVTDLRLVPSNTPGEYLLSATVAAVR